MKQLPKVARKLLWVTAILVLASGLLVALALNYLRDQAHVAAHQSTAATARIVQEQTERTLQNVDQRLQKVAWRLEQFRASGALNAEFAQAMLVAEVREMPFMRAMWVMDAKGVILYDSDRRYAGVNLADRAYFQIYVQQPDTGLYLGAPVKSRVTTEWVISAARPLHRANGAFAGIVVAALNPAYFDKLWAELDLGDGGSVSLFRRDAVLMLRSPWVEAAIGKAFPDLLAANYMPPGQNSGTLETASRFDQVQRTYAYRNLSTYPAVVVVGKTHDTTFTPWQRMATLASGVWLLASACIVVLVCFLVRDLARRETAEQQLRENKAKKQAMLDALPDLMFELGANGHFYDYHSPRPNLLAAPPEEFLGKTLHDILPPEAAEIGIKTIQEALTTGHSSGQQICLSLPQGEHWFELSAARKAQLPGEDPRCIVLSRDITPRKHAEQALQASLDDKVGLLNEVHHRVKNNLQVITSLLRLEGNRSAQAETRTVLDEMQGRIRSMALLHESLYRTGTFASVELGAYLRQLCTQAFRTGARQNDGVQLVLDLAPVQVTMDQATPCGLLVNELVSNCLKHGFPNGRTGEVRVALTPVDAQWRLSVRDNGVGLPADFDTRRAASLGLQLVTDLARQLGATLVVGPGPGAAFSITFTSQISL